MFFFGCTQIAQRGNNNTDATLANGNLIVSNETMQSVDLKIRIGDRVSFSKEITVNKETSLLSLLKYNKKYYYDIAYSLAKNNGDVKLHLNIPDIFDTTITYHLDVIDIPQYNTKVLVGECARLSGVFDAENVESDIIKWLYRNNLGNVGDESVEKIRLYLKELNRDDMTEFVANETIPVVTSFKGLDYKVSSDLVADNYYLFACKSESEIEDFVEEMISVKFDGAVHSLNQPIPCYRAESTLGTICIFLIGINNDWKYKVSPIGLICIDNVAPTYYDLNKHLEASRINNNSDIILDKNNIRITMPSDIPAVTGYASLGTNDWGGNGISCKVNFVVSFGGDVKSITLKREGSLTEYLGRATKTIDLQKETSPYLFSFELHLEEGDNYVPVIITDLRGNKTEFKYNVGCEKKE